MLVAAAGEGLQALQHLVATRVPQAARRRQRMSSTAWTSARGKDNELRQMAQFIAEKAQDIGHRAGASAR